MTQRVFVILVAALLSVACGSDDSGDSVESSCRALCDKQGEASDCSGDLASYVSLCKQLCSVISAQLDADCKAKAEAAFTCQTGLDYECISSGGDEVPIPTTTGCQAEAAAYADCLPGGGE